MFHSFADVRAFIPNAPGMRGSRFVSVFGPAGLSEKTYGRERSAELGFRFGMVHGLTPI